MPEIKVIDTTLRDAHQSLWATRMTTAMMIPVAEKMDRAGFEAIDLMGGPQFDACVRYLKENPWERLRQIRQRVTQTKLQGIMRSKNMLTFDVQPDDINYLWLETLAKNGIRRVRTMEPMLDVDTIVDITRRINALGIESVIAPIYTLSPIHTDEFYAGRMKAVMDQCDVDIVMLKDPGGLLTPDRVRTLVPALQKVLGKAKLEIHSHCITGLAPLVYLDAVRLGVTQIQTSIAPLANGQAQPATQTMVRNLRDLGYTVNLDDKLVDEVGAHFGRVAESEGLPVGQPMAYDEFHYQHQIPGGMMANLKSQLKDAGLMHRFPEVLEETALVREELGWPIMVTPFSQMVGVQAVMNVIQGERYKHIPDEMKKYVLGYFGKLMAPVQPDVLDRIISNGSPRIAHKPPVLDPVLPTLRKHYPNMDDEERMLRYLFKGTQVDDMLAAGPMKTEYFFDKPLVHLVRELAKRKLPGRVYIEKGATRLDVAPAS